MKEELYNAIKEHKAYDYIASNWWQLGQEELKDVALEFIYAFEKITLYDNYKTDDIVNELKERWED